MFKSILVPLDGTAFAEHIIPLACQLARDAGAQLHLVEVSEEVVYGTEFGAIAMVADRGNENLEDYLAKTKQRLAPECQQVTTKVLPGPVVPALKEYVEKNGIDLVAMATHGRAALARAWFGSVSDELMRAISVPLLLFRPDDHGTNPIPSGRFRHIVVALDGTKEAETILAPALALAKMCKAEMTLLRVLDPIPVLASDIPVGGMPAVAPEILAEIRSNATRNLEHIAQSIQKLGISVTHRVFEYPNASSGIVDHSKELKADLIVLATHGYGGFSRLVLGSVTDQVIRHTCSAILVYHTIPPAVPVSSDRAPRVKSMDSDELTTVFTTGDPNLAQMVVNELQSEGIQAMVSGENQAGLSGILDVEVLVRTWDADRARKIIDEGGHHNRPSHGRDPDRRIPADSPPRHIPPHGKKPHIG